ncbi:vWA domain-containing protein [Winogradskyella thalassocola]|uniref:Ca-activated chloride channel family protein n=1 Tax=Winogradskyella thalassocola TaxID=262004 RepID=A0A1G8KIE9_9FLAO|nr:VWA domain-containing protein [Winogradskyella thalassocola]SDI43172.1 Ca-activated chloride channel family protein [Winogradskyella thalassocola]
MKNLVLILCFMLSTGYIIAQEKTISGTITTAGDGLPLPGASVIIKGSSIGAQTDFDGKYKLKANVGDIIMVSYIGMQTQNVTIGSGVIYDIALESDNALDEVIVVGYGTSSRDGYTHYSKPRPTLASKLSGKVSGVSVTNSNGTPGTSSNIVIRGTASANSKKPLYILNGKPISENEFRNIKADKIKHIEILNARQGNTVYGYEGTKGVIILRTKGHKNKINFDDIDNFLNESYTQIEENTFKRTQLAALSTFSIDVDKAGYSNVRRMINNGETIPPNAVKLEEMVNYFNYNYPQPTDEHPFSINTEVVTTPWHKDTQLVRIGLQGKTYDNDKLPASNLTFLIDVSGSMGSQNKLPLLKSAFKLLVNQLREKDKVSIVVYAGAAGVVLEPTSGDKKQTILAALDNLNSGGSTAGGAGIELAYKLAEKNFKKTGNNRVILATDGDFNVGASGDNEMQALIEEKRKSGVFLSVLGFGYGNYKDSKLEILADKGNGNHAYIDNMQEAQKVFGKEFGGTLFTIAKDVKIQVEFNPKKVQAYRLIGYENRLLADEDFVDDTKDAGELGSGHTVTALYEIIPTGVKSHYLKKVPDLKYTKSEVASHYDDELFTVKFRYKNPNEDKSIEMIHIQENKISEASNDMNFASAVALFGMQLRHSKYSNNTSSSKVLELAEGGRGDDKDGYRAEFIRLVKSYDNIN